MGIEIERKFLVTGNSWKKNVRAKRCRQGYVCLGSGTTVRVRIMDDQGYLTVKGRGKGIIRNEFEYAIPLNDAEEMLESVCKKPAIEKNRYTLVHEGMTWEIDEFFGENSGLIIAEIELQREDQMFSLPTWVGREVTGDPRFYNVSLVQQPFSQWFK